MPLISALPSPNQPVAGVSHEQLGHQGSCSATAFAEDPRHHRRRSRDRVGDSGGGEPEDHQVHERAWVTVIDGEVEITTTDGEAITGGRGLMVEFAPGERHAVLARSTARLLLLLTPWPGDGHPGPVTHEDKSEVSERAAEHRGERVTSARPGRLRAGSRAPAAVRARCVDELSASDRSRVSSVSKSKPASLVVRRARGRVARCFETHRFLRRGPVKAEGWSQLVAKDRDWERSYRGRWAHDKVVRSTHGVNCTGSCSWQVFVKDGLITWESQAVDYPVDGGGDAGVRAARLPPGSVVLLVSRTRRCD